MIASLTKIIRKRFTTFFSVTEASSSERAWKTEPETFKIGNFRRFDNAFGQIIMLDLIFILAIIGFFLAALAYVRGCEELN